MAIGELTNNDNIKVALTERDGQGYLLFRPPTKLRAKGWVDFQRGPFALETVQDQLAGQGLTLQEMVCEFFDCSSKELEALPYVELQTAVDFYRVGSSLDSL